MDLDAQRNVVSLAIEHASLRSDLSEFAFQRLGKGPGAHPGPTG